MANLREKTKIKEDIEASDNVTRQDVYEVLMHSKDKKKKDRKKDVEDFLDTLPGEIKHRKKTGEVKDMKEKILDDLESYPV